MHRHAHSESRHVALHVPLPIRPALSFRTFRIQRFLLSQVVHVGARVLGGVIGIGPERDYFHYVTKRTYMWRTELHAAGCVSWDGTAARV